MITIESPPSLAGSGMSGITRPAVSRFLLRAQHAVGLEGDVHVLLGDDATLRRLNKAFRDQDKATDVLSFPAGDGASFASEPGGRRMAGDLAISLETAARQATRYGHTIAQEVRILLLHGLLHLAGFDHEQDSGEMAEREAELRQELGLPTGLIARAGKPAVSTAARVPARVSAARRARA